MQYMISFLFALGLSVVYTGAAGIESGAAMNNIKGLQLVEDYLADKPMKRLENSAFSIREALDIMGLLEVFEDFKLKVARPNCDEKSQALRSKLIAVSNANPSQWLVAKMISTLADRLAAACQKEYARVYFKHLEMAKSEEVDATINQIRPFFLAIMHSWLDADAAQSQEFGADYDAHLKWASGKTIRDSIYNEFMVKIPLIETRRDAAIAYKAIEELVKKKDQSNSNQELPAKLTYQLLDDKLIISGEQAKELFTRFIVNSCEHYVGLFGPKVFDLAQEDVSYLIHNDLRCQHDADLSDYYLAWAQYKACRVLLTNDSVREKLLDHLEEIADNEIELRTRPDRLPDIRNRVNFGLTKLFEED